MATYKPRPVAQEYKSLRIHPYNIVLTLLLMGLSTLFLGFTAAYIYTRYTTGILAASLPKIFIYNSVFLIGSSVCLWQAVKSYKADNTKAYQLALGGALALTVVFLIAQVYAWGQLGDIRGQLGSGYIKALSIMHFGHVVGGIPFLAWFLITAIRRMKEPVSVLVYFSDPEKRLKLRLLNIYWHFLDFLWIFLVALFLLSGFF